MRYSSLHKGLPTMAKDEQRVQMSWRDFCNRMVVLVKVDIY